MRATRCARSRGRSRSSRCAAMCKRRRRRPSARRTAWSSPPASRHPGRCGHPEAGRQRGRCRGRRRLRARRRVSRGGKPRRRRLHDAPARGRTQDVHRFPREGPAGRDGRHVPRSRRQRHPRPQHQGLSCRGRARQRGRVRAGARQVRHDEARGRHRAGHPPRAARLRAGAGRRRHAGRRRRGFPRRRAVGRDLPRPGRAAQGRTAPRADGPRAHAAAHRMQRRRWVLQGSDRRRHRRGEHARQGHHHQGGPRAVPGARAGADRVRLPRLSHRVGAAAQLGRRDRLRNSGHPRGLPAARAGLPLGAGRALPDRGHAPRVRGSQQLSRRSGFRDATRSSGCWTRATPRRSAPRSTRPGRAFPATSSPASRRTKAPTPRTTRSSTRPATPWR